MGQTIRTSLATLLSISLSYTSVSIPLRRFSGETGTSTRRLAHAIGLAANINATSARNQEEGFTIGLAAQWPPIGQNINNLKGLKFKFRRITFDSHFQCCEPISLGSYLFPTPRRAMGARGPPEQDHRAKCRGLQLLPRPPQQHQGGAAVPAGCD